MSSPVFINSNTTIDTGYDIYFVDCSSNNITLELPEIYDGQYYTIKRIDTSLTYTLTITINSDDSCYIDDDGTSITLPTHNSVDLYSFNNSWFITGGYNDHI